MLECADPIIGLSGESPATAGTPKAQAPPGNAQAHERQIAGALESGERLGGHPPKGSGASAPDLSGHRTEGGEAFYARRSLYWNPEHL